MAAMMKAVSLRLQLGLNSPITDRRPASAALTQSNRYNRLAPLMEMQKPPRPEGCV